MFGFARQPPAADPWETWLNDGAALLVERIELGPISIIAVRSLAQLLGDAPLLITLAQRLHQEGEGSPTSSQMIRGLAEEGVILMRAGAGAWASASAPSPTRHCPCPAASARPSKSACGASSPRCCVWRRSWPCAPRGHPDVILEATGGDEHALDDALEELTERGVLRVRQVGQEELLGLSRARIRDGAGGLRARR
ncbi:MAG: hypothetical protein IPN01_15070 [Deltaproteobacteria bacterium]|nr:hypothetical protein [Deltaproteobacteria bacterium]